MNMKFKIKKMPCLGNGILWSTLIGVCTMGSISWASGAEAEETSAQLATMNEVEHTGALLTFELSSNSQEVLNCVVAPAVELAPGGDTVVATAQTVILRPRRSLAMSFNFTEQIKSVGDAAKDGIKAYLPKASQLACEIIREDANLWVDDNGAARQAQEPDQYRYQLLYKGEKPYMVEVALQSVASYTRFCDAVINLAFSTPDGDVRSQELVYWPKLNLHAGELLHYAVDINDILASDPRLILEELTVSMACLRWTGVTIPDPQANQKQRPKLLPHVVCDPLKTNCGPLVLEETDT